MLNLQNCKCAKLAMCKVQSKNAKLIPVLNQLPKTDIGYKCEWKCQTCQ